MILQIFLSFLCTLIFLIVAGIFIKSSILYLENNPHKSKNFVFFILILSIVLHYLLYLFNFSKIHLIFSIFTQILFLSLFEEYPYMKSNDIRFILGILFTIINHFITIFSVRSKSLGILQVLFSFLIIWISPVIFLFSLSATEEIISFDINKRTILRKIAELLDGLKNKKGHKE